MWRFSYLAAERGGAAFVLLYLAFTAFIGLPILLAELSIGRGAQRSPVEALAHYGGRSWRWLGLIFVAAGFLILSYYSVIAGWTLRYLGAALTSAWGSDPAAYFVAIREGPGAIGFHLAFMAMTIAIVTGGVKGGIERAAMLMMPLLFAIVIGIAIYASTLEGASEGYRYYLEADFSMLRDPELLADAAGQAFFSLSLGMGAMLTYGSYLGRDTDLPSSSIIIAGADFGVAFVSGLMIFPLIFALGLQTAVIGTAGTEQEVGTLGALFVTLPRAFIEMGDAGRIVGLLFFAALTVGALTSAISLLEVVVSSAIDVLGISRQRAALFAGAAIALLGIPSALQIGTLDVADTVANNLFLIGGGLGLALFTGWVMRDPIAQISQGAQGIRWYVFWRPLLRFVVPLVLLYVLWRAVPPTLVKIAGLFGA
jgi:NSS family neurotransmitter:Na+ symporter